MSATDHTTKRSCPCKRLPLTLSSFTAAELGDVHSLSRSTLPLASRDDGFGNTPLHLAAQHGHVAATALLLQSGCDVNSSTSGATPLHRASFSGAIATMRLLLDDRKCHLLAIDTSFGDRRTPLHKAAAGGRYLAVQLLWQVLEERHLLVEALAMRDAHGQTALQVAESLLIDEEVERASVARWDGVAGGRADWRKCVQLLSAATVDGCADWSAAKTLPIPQHLQSDEDCRDCSGECLTDSWTRAFQQALSTSTNNRLSTTALSTPEAKAPPTDTTTESTKESDDAGASSTNTTAAMPDASLGRACDSCGKRTFALFRRDKALVCRKCRRHQR